MAFLNDKNMKIHVKSQMTEIYSIKGITNLQKYGKTTKKKGTKITEVQKLLEVGKS